MKNGNEKPKEKISPSKAGNAPEKGAESSSDNQTKALGRPFPRFAQDFSGESKTQQQFKNSSDVNTIVNHYRTTGIDPHADRLAKQTFGYASSQSFEEALRATAEVQSAFNELPATERSDFANDPAQWLDHLATPPPEPEEIVAPEPSQEPADPKIEAKKPDSAEIDST